MKKKTILALAAVLCLNSGMTVCAEPKAMPDGTVFDAEYYAKSNPDVAAICGMNEDFLYQHYVNYGKSEGRLACSSTNYEETLGIEGHGKIVSSYRYYNGLNAEAFVYTYEDGYQIVKAFTEKPYNAAHVEDQYVIPRTDFCDGLLDADHNGIDDRDPYNFCGYTDLNYNCYADGAPVKEDMCPEAEAIMYRMCEHGVVDGFDICHHEECEARRERLRHVTIY